MKTTYDEALTMREARRMYFEVNNFGITGGYDDKWVDFKLGPIPMPFRNTAARVRAVRHHDLHHLLTGYDTDIVGEFEISAWEIAAGCRDFVAAWALNLGGMAGGLLRAPRRTFAAFVRGRGERSTYGEDLEATLDLTVGQARARYMPGPARRATLADALLFAVAVTAGVAVGLMLLAFTLALLPLALVTNALKKRDDRAQEGLASSSCTGSGQSSSMPTR